MSTNVEVVMLANSRSRSETTDATYEPPACCFTQVTFERHFLASCFIETGYSVAPTCWFSEAFNSLLLLTSILSLLYCVFIVSMKQTPQYIPSPLTAVVAGRSQV